MNIAYIEYSIAQKSLDIFISGCNNQCKDCCNPEIKDFTSGKDWHEYIETIFNYLKKYDELIENIFLVGGSPNHQNTKDLEEFFNTLNTNKKIWLFAGEELDKIQNIFKQKCDFIKCGEYIPSLQCDDNIQYGIKLATSNQKIYKKGEDY